jgi:hypothetical protein
LAPSGNPLLPERRIFEALIFPCAHCGEIAWIYLRPRATAKAILYLVLHCSGDLPESLNILIEAGGTNKLIMTTLFEIIIDIVPPILPLDFLHYHYIRVPPAVIFLGSIFLVIVGKMIDNVGGKVIFFFWI